MTHTDLILDHEYILDKKFNNSSVIKLVRVYGKYFCRVKDPEGEYEWDVMCGRLTEKEIKNKK
jgi:hypothetical protein